MDKYITMSQKELRQYDIIKKVIKKELKGVEAARLLKVTDRHVRRLKNAVLVSGAEGLVHAGRDKPGNRRIPDKERNKIADLVSRHYSDFGPLLASEKLAERHNIKRDKGTIRSIMIAEGVWKPKNKRKKEHRSWRQRRAALGEMVQYDGSYEYWLEDRGEKSCLLAAVDDATGRVWAQFDEHEGVWPTFKFWQEYIERFGKPYSIYVDKFSTYSMNHKLAQENPDTLTQFQRAMEKDLNIEVIRAHSAAAKGRVEKLFKTLQDRLIKEMRLKNISNIKEANKFLVEEYLSWFNAKFMVEPRSKANLHKPLKKQEAEQLEAVFSRQYERVIRNDFTIQHQGHKYQLLKEQPVTIFKNDKVTVEKRRDGSVHFRLRGKYLNCQILPPEPKKINTAKKDRSWVIPRSVQTPAPNHPWRHTVYNHK